MLLVNRRHVIGISFAIQRQEFWPLLYFANNVGKNISGIFNNSRGNSDNS